MPRPSWAGVLGMLRTIWRWPRTLESARVVAPAMMLMTSGVGADRALELAADADQHLRLDGQHDDVGVLDGARVVLDGADRVAADQLAAVDPPAGGWR